MYTITLTLYYKYFELLQSINVTGYEIFVLVMINDKLVSSFF